MDLVEIFARCRDQISESGLRLYETDDAENAMQMVHASGKQYITPHVWPLYNDLTRDNYFWLFLLDKENDRIQGVIAARKDLLRPNEYTRFWYNHYKRLSDTDFGGEIDRSYESLGDKYIHGECVYIGDYYCNPAAKINQTAFVSLAHITAILRWQNAQIHYGYISQRDANRGQAFRLMMNNTSRNVHRWIKRPSKRSDTDVLIWITRADLNHELRNFFTSSDAPGEREHQLVPVGTPDR